MQDELRQTSEHSWGNRTDYVNFLEKRRKGRVDGYKSNPDDIQEHVATERRVTESGYLDRQINEIIQNSSDAITRGRRSKYHWAGEENARIEIILTNDCLYAANTGAPLDEDGLKTLLQANISEKENQIGRFGIGFKSLLAYTDTPEVFSRTISVRFDRDDSREFLRDRLNNDFDTAPVLRIGWPVKPLEEFAKDSYLNQLKEWAATIVRVPFNSDRTEHPEDRVRKQFKNFASEFALFEEHSSRIVFRDAVKNWKRRIHVEQGENTVTLQDEDESSHWRVFERFLEWSDLSSNATRDGGELYKRDEIPIQWAVPVGETPEAQQFWSWFPLSEDNRVPGLLNSYWKTNDDRKNLLSPENSSYNRELLEASARLIADSMPECHDHNHPEFIVDLYPRQDGGNEETAGFLAEKVWEKIRSMNVVPDANGHLQSVDELYRQPASSSSDPVKKWAEYAREEKKHQYVHPDVFTRERSARYKTLLEKLDEEFEKEEACPDLQDWIEAITSTTVEASGKAIEVLFDLSETRRSGDLLDLYSRDDIDKLEKDIPLVLTKNESLKTIESNLYFQSRKSGNVNPDKIVHPDLQTDPYEKTLRNKFGIDEYDPISARANELYDLLDKSDPDWNKFWNDLARYPENDRPKILKSVKDRRSYRTSFFIRTVDGTWREADSVIWPEGNTLNPETLTPEDQEFLVDGDFHRDHRHAIQEVLDVPSKPKQNKTFYKGDLKEYWDQADRVYTQKCTECGASTKYKAGLVLKNKRTLDWFENVDNFLVNGSQGIRQFVTSDFLDRADDLFTSLSIEHKNAESSRNDYPRKVKIPNPLGWALLRYGRIYCSGFSLTLPEAIWAEREGFDISVRDDLKELYDLLFQKDVWQAFTENLSKIEKFTDIENESNLWRFLLAWAKDQDEYAEKIIDIYDSIARTRKIPDEVRSVTGKIVQVDESRVTVNRNVIEQEAPSTFVVRSEDARKKYQEAGADPVSPEVVEEGTDETFDLSDLLGTAADVFRADNAEEKQNEYLVPVKRQDFLVEIDPDSDEVKTPDFYYDQEEKVLRIQKSFGPPFSYVQQKKVLENLINCVESREPDLEKKLDSGWEARSRRMLIQDVGDPKHRLLYAVDGEPQKLIKALPDRLEGRDLLNILTYRDEEEDITPKDLSNVLLQSYGLFVLYEMNRAGLFDDTPYDEISPGRWTTGAKTMNFVRELGFPEEFAVDIGGNRDAGETAHGPVHLPELHDYQDAYFTALCEHFKVSDEQQGSGKRAVIGLPTGAGKTRVAVQYLVENLLTNRQRIDDEQREPDPEPDRLVIWIAHRDELCEQAVQSFQKIWGALGAPDSELAVGRLWSNSRGNIRHRENVPQVIVTTNLTLANKFDRNEGDWLKNADFVVVDETHRGIAKTYTTVLERNLQDSTPVLGLSATPYRNDEEETKRLVSRFGEQRIEHLIPEEKFPDEIPSMYKELQDENVLSDMDMVNIDSGVEVTLTEEEVIQRDKYDFLKKTLPERSAKELARDEDRNRRLMEEIESEALKGKVLLFACTVGHAHQLAFRVNLDYENITARCIEGETSQGLRKKSIERFREGEVDVLTNYQVLTIGFDAPAVDTIIVARPTFSTILYQQMLGRGIRGPKNGGTEQCKVVCIRDNLEKFSSDIAFDKFAYLWKEQTNREWSI